MLHVEAREDETLDLLFGGSVRLLQARTGYRTSVDSMLVAWFATAYGAPHGEVLDLGAGSGLISVMMALACPQCRFTLVEKQPQLGMRALRNLAINGLRGRLLPLDLGEAPPLRGIFDVVVSNPPFYRSPGRILPSNDERRIAHYESSATLERFLQVGAQFMRTNGRMCVIFPAEEASRVVAGLIEAGCGSMAIKWVHHRSLVERPTRILVVAHRGPTDVVTLPALCLHPDGAPDSTYAPELETFLRGLAPAPRRSFATRTPSSP